MLRNFNRALYTILNALIKPLLLLPIALGIMAVNYNAIVNYVPPLTEEEYYQMSLVEALLAGESMEGYGQFDERELTASYVQHIPYSLNTVALGSSRILQLGQEAAGTPSFFNCGMSGADFYDILGTFYLFDKAGKLPQNLIIALDPWLLNGDLEAFSPRSDIDLYNEFLALKLGIDTDYAPAPQEQETPLTLETLLSLEDFRTNLLAPVAQNETLPEPDLPLVQGDVTQQPTDIMLGDGSVMYSAAFRGASMEEVNNTARVDASTFLRMRDFHTLDEKNCDIFTQFIHYVQGQGVNVVFLLTPYHPIVYTYAFEKYTDWEAFFETEPWYRQLAAENNIPIYGSYNPFVAGCWGEDFYDGLHIRRESLSKIFPGIPAVLEQQQQGMAGSDYALGQRSRITEDTAMHIAHYFSPLPDSQNYTFGGLEEVDGAMCYRIERYSGTQWLASYAVSMEEGWFYRYDTGQRKWVYDLKFS